MVNKCCVSHCTGNSKNQKEHVFKFPHDEEMKNKWLRAIRRQNLQVANHTVVSHIFLHISSNFLISTFSQ